ncbi:Vesicle-associated membrane protein [Dinochytrium kinnereticum]|nr:Vesicle-associated membrane protein [Dinochytrium kinnereticum]
MTYVYDRYLFHYVQQKGVIYLCLTDDTFGRRIPFAFLEDIARRFESLYSDRAHTAIAYGLNEFSRTIASQMEYYSSDPASDRLRQVQGEIDQVKDVMVSNIEKVLERGERIDILVDKTDNLNQASFAFKKRSTALRRELWWKNSKLLVTLGGAGLFLIYFFAAISCGFPTFQHCR